MVETEIYSRVVGYYRPTNQWNKGKQEEFKERKEYNFKQAKEKHMKLLVETVLENNHINYTGNPIIIVFRNTNIETGEYIPDTGENALDGFILYSENGIVTMQGRTVPNWSYLRKYFSDGKLQSNERFNYVAPCYVKYAFKKGPHRGYDALRQNRKFPILRSLDEILGNDDDYISYEWPCDNFHGWLKSLGCWTVAGSMKTLTGDWGQAYNWIYHTNDKTNEFDALCLERTDYEQPNKERLRFGSAGEKVRELQAVIGARIDGDFGFRTLQALVKFQNQGGDTTGYYEL